MLVKLSQHIHIINKVLLTPSVLKVRFLHLYVQLRVSGSESVPCGDIVYAAQNLTICNEFRNCLEFIN